MPRKSDPQLENLAGDDTDGWLGRVIADEDGPARPTLWRIASWGVAACGAVALALMSNHLAPDAPPAQVASAELVRKTDQAEQIARESRLEARRLAAAVESLTRERERIVARLSAVEQNVDSVTGSIARQQAAPATPPVTKSALPDTPVLASAPAVTSPAEPTAAAVVAPAPAEAVPAVAEPVTIAPGIQAAVMPAASATTQERDLFSSANQPDDEAVAPPAFRGENSADARAVPQTAFGLDLGGADSIGGLRTLWTRLRRTHGAELAALQPVMSVRERRSGNGVQLRLVAGPIRDAAAAAKLCAVFLARDRECVTAEFDGQRLAMQEAVPPKPAAAPKAQRRRSSARRIAPAEPARAARPEASVLSSVFQ
jgi:hypothetical protein